MKQIIKGKAYDTEKAKFVARWGNGYHPTDFQYYSELLYRKRTGEFFLHGEGGPMSKYAESCGNNTWSGGEKIIPLSYNSAREWAEEHLTADEYEAIFGTVTEDETHIAVTLSLSVASIERAKRAAAQAGMSLSGYVESLID